MRSQMAKELTPKAGPQLERHAAASKAPWRLNSDLKEARLNSDALACQARVVRRQAIEFRDTDHAHRRETEPEERDLFQPH